MNSLVTTIIFLHQNITKCTWTNFDGRYHNQGVGDYNPMFYIVIELRLCWLPKGKQREKSRAMHQEAMTFSFAGTCKIGIYLSGVSENDI